MEQVEGVWVKDMTPSVRFGAICAEVFDLVVPSPMEVSATGPAGWPAHIRRYNRQYGHNS